MTAPASVRRPVDVLKDLPMNIEAEKSFLGSVFIDNGVLDREILTPEDFRLESHRRIYMTMLELWEGRIPIDPVILSDRLEKKDWSRHTGGVDYLDELSWVVPTGANASHYARILKEQTALRKAKILNAQHAQAIEEGDLEKVERIEKKIAERENPEQTGKTIWVDAFDICQQPLSPVEWLVDGLFPRSGAGTVDGPPESGKSSLVVNLAATIANSGGCWFGKDCLSGPVVVLGGEKSSQAVWRRDFERLGKVARSGYFLIPELDGPLWKWDRREGVWIKTHSYAEAVRGIKRIKPVLVLGDTIMRLGLGIDQIDNAQQAMLGLELEELAAEAGCLFLTIGHTNQASTKEALSWRLHYLSRAGGNGLPGVLRYCFAVTRIHRADVQKNGELEGMFSPEEVSFRKLIACGVSKGNEIPTASWTNNRPAFFEIMPSGEIMMLDKDFPEKGTGEERMKYEEVSIGYEDPFADL